MEVERSHYNMDFSSILKKANLSLNSDAEKIRVQSKFYFTDRGNIGLIFFLGISLFLFYISVFKAKETGAQIFLMILSIAILVFTVLVILKQLKDFLEIYNGRIKFSNTLKDKEVNLNSAFKIKVKSDIIHVKTRRSSSGSYFCVVELFLKINDEKFRILDFEVDKKDSKEAKKLGKEIKKMILEKVNEV